MFNTNLTEISNISLNSTSHETFSTNSVGLLTGLQLLLHTRINMDRQARIRAYEMRNLPVPVLWEQQQLESSPFYQLGVNLKNGATYLKNCLFTAKNNLSDFFVRFSPPQDNFITEDDMAYQGRLRTELNSHYLFFSEKIDAAYMEAQQLSKPLMILIGEEHDTLNSAITEAIILQLVLDKKIPITAILTEAFDSKIYRKRTFTAPIVEKLASHYGIKTIPMDLGTCDFHLKSQNLRGCDSQKEDRYLVDSIICEQNKDVIRQACANSHRYEQLPPQMGIDSPEGVFFRNKGMGEFAINMASEEQHMIAIVGAAHLHIVKETKLNDHYHILLINTYMPQSDLSIQDLQPQQDYEEKIHSFTHDSQVLQFKMKSSARRFSYLSEFSPADIIKHTKVALDHVKKFKSDTTPKLN